MMKLTLPAEKGAPLKVLCLGAHSDDIEIGCGGTLLKLLREGAVEVRWVVLSAEGAREEEAREGAARFLAGAAGREVILKSFRMSYFPFVGDEIKDFFETLKKGFDPDLVFTHYRNDLHQDHRLVNQLTWNSFRDHLILEYEITKFDGDIGNPNLFVHLDEETCRGKVGHILSSFRSQKEKGWFTEDLFFSILRLRGVESNAPGRYAEAFYCRKAVL